jgi:sulfonate transport system substrate-binding protein
MRQVVFALAVGVILLAGRFSPAASQEVKEIAVAQQFGAIFIPLMAMENMQLIEKQAQARGIGDLKVSWAKLAGPSVMVRSCRATCISPPRACPPCR